MSSILEEAVASVPLSPDRPYRARFGNRIIDVRMAEAACLEDEVGADDCGMVEIWLNIPRSENAFVMDSPIRPVTYPKPIQIDETDLAPE